MKKQMPIFLLIILCTGCGGAIVPPKPSGIVFASLSEYPTPPASYPTPTKAALPTRTPTPPSWGTPPSYYLTPHGPTSTPVSTLTPKVFPTPDISVTPGITQPSGLMGLWYAHYSANPSELILQRAWIDQNGRRWVGIENDKRIPTGFVPRQTPLNGIIGPEDFFISPNGNYIIETQDFGAATIFDLNAGWRKYINAGFGGPAKVSWARDSSHYVGSPQQIPSRVPFISITGTQVGNITYPENSPVGELIAFEYSMDDDKILDAINYPNSVQIGLWLNEKSERTAIFDLPQSYLFSGSLRWISNTSAIFVMERLQNGSLQRNDVSGRILELWKLDVNTGNARKVRQLAETSHFDEISPLSQEIVIIEQRDETGSDNLFKINLADGMLTQLTHFVKKNLSKPTVSPNKQWVAFTLNNSDYAEIWTTSIDGTVQQVVAGPTLVGAPSFWIR